MIKAQADHKEFVMRKFNDASTSLDLSELPDDLREFAEELKQGMKPQQFRQLAQGIIEEYVSSHGGRTIYQMTIVAI